jgi:CzcA family heavy metal efflux pump
MLKFIVSSALSQRVLVLAAAVAVMLAGIVVTKDAPLDVFPEFAPPMVEVQTEAPGLSTEEVDSMVTVPLENALNGMPFLKTIRSKSVLGLSSVTMVFQPGTDVLKARQWVQERLNLARNRLPVVAMPPVLMAPGSSMSRILKIGLRSDSLTQTQLSELATWTLRPRLMSVPGVANVAIWGQRDRQIQVLVDPQQLRAAGVSLDAVTRAAGEAVTVGAGGFIDTPNLRMGVQQLPAVRNPGDLARAMVEFRNSVPLRVGDVADVKEGNPQPIGDAVINDGDGLLLVVEKQPWGNTLEVTAGVEKVLMDMKPGLPGVDIDSTIFRPASFIRESMHHLTEALWMGCLLVVLVLVLLLGNWRTTIVSVVALPLSLSAALLLLRMRGETLNTMVLAGLIIALGEVVDDAIIDVENILRRLRLNAALASPRPRMPVVLEASLEVRSAVVYASLIIVLVFLPVFFLPGLAGTFFRPLALSYILAIGASLAVALTVTPALSLMLLGHDGRRETEPALARFVKGLYRRVLPRVAEKPTLAMAVLAAAFAMAAWVWHGRLKEEFLPSFKERDFLMHWVEKPNTSLDASKRITIAAATDLLKVPGVRNHGAHIGRAEVADEVVGPDFTELWISLDRSAPYDATVRAVQAVVDGYPGLTRDLLTFLRERIKEVLTGASASVVVRVFGPDLDSLRSHAADAAVLLKDIPGISALKVEAQALVPHVTVRLRPDHAALHGLTPGAVRTAVTTLIKGRKVGEVYADQKVHDVVVWGVPAARTDPSALADLLVDTPTGGHARLADIADIAVVPTPNAIKREGASRRIDVTCNIASGSALGDVVREVERRVGAMAFPPGYHVEVLGEWAERKAAQSRLAWLSAASLAGIIVLLFSDFQSLRLTLLSALTLPFALIGGVIAAWLGGGVISLGSMVGFVTILGIAARNGILLVSHYRHLEREEGQSFGLALVLRGSEERLLPILMTAATAGLALLPIVLKGEVPGNEIERPMAWVILGGLVTSTALNLCLLPALYLRFGRASTVEAEGRPVLRAAVDA